MNVDRYGNTSSGSIPLALADAAADGRLHEGELVLMTGMGAGLTWGSALIEWTERNGVRREQDRLHVPGPGLVRGRDGTRRRRGGARGDGGVRRRQRGVRAGPAGALLPRAARGPARHEGAAACARRDEPRDQRGDPGARDRARTSSSATRSASSRRSAPPASIGAADAIGLVRERGIAMAEAAQARPGSMAAILGLADEVVEGLCRKIVERVAGELQLPRPDRRSRARTTPSASAAPRRSARALAARSGCGSPARSTRRSSSGRPTSCARRSSGSTSTSRATAFMSTVTAKLEDAQPLPRAARRAADRARQVHAGGARADRQGRDDVRRGRPRQRAQRFTEEDRQERAHRLRQRPRRPARVGGDACLAA